MSNPSGAKGTKGETARVRWLQSRGWRYATRIPKKGNRDCGDLILDQTVPVMVESKETKSFTPSIFIKEMEAQISHAGAEFGFVMVKRRGTADVGQYYALTTVEQMLSLIERVWAPPLDEPTLNVSQRTTPPPVEAPTVIAPQRRKRVLKRRAT